MKQFIDDNGQEWGFDIGDAHFFADEEMTIELPTRAFSKEQIAQIMGGVPIIRCKDCKYFYKEERYCVLGTVAISDGYCYLGERKEE